MTLCNENFLSPAGFRLDIPGFKSIGFQCTNAIVPGISMNGPTQATPYNDFQLAVSYTHLTLPTIYSV